MKTFGLTLAFTVKEGKSLTGVLKSYAVRCNDLEELKSKAVKIGEDFLKRTVEDGQRSKYLGVADLINITGTLEEGSILGQAFFEELSTLTSAKKIVKKNTEFSYSITPTSAQNLFYCNLVYFFKGSGKPKQQFAFTVATIVDAQSIEKGIKRAIKLANSKQFVDEIVRYSDNGMDASSISFLGMENFYLLDEDSIRESCFQSYYKRIKSEEEVKEFVLSASELKTIYLGL